MSGIPLRGPEDARIRASLVLKDLHSETNPDAIYEASVRFLKLPYWRARTPEWLIRRRGEVKRKHALHLIALEHGYPSWQALLHAFQKAGPDGLADVRNTLLRYEYVDLEHHRRLAYVVVSGEAPGDAEARIRSTLADPFQMGEREWFIARQVGIPEVFLWNDQLEYVEAYYPEELIGSQEYKLSEADHVWHRFTGLAPTSLAADDRRTVEQVVTAFEDAARQGWDDSWPEGVEPPVAPEVVRMAERLISTGRLGAEESEASAWQAERRTFVLVTSGDRNGTFDHKFRMGLVTLTPEDARALLAEMDAVAAMQTRTGDRSREVAFADHRVRFYGSPEGTAGFVDRFDWADDMGASLEATDVISGFDPQGQTPADWEYTEAVVTDDSVYWRGSPKHSSVEMETSPLWRDDLQRVADGATMELPYEPDLP